MASWKREYYLHCFKWQSIIWIGLAIISFLYQIELGMIVLLISFFANRYTYKEKQTYHSNKSSECSKYTLLLFAICGLPLIIINQNISLLFPIIIGIISTYYLWKIVYKEKESKKVFNLKTCTKEELLNRCREQGLNHDQTEKAIKHFYLRLSHKDIIDEYGSIECSKTERNRLKKLLLKETNSTS